MNKDFTEENTQIDDKHMKRCTTLSVIRKRKEKGKKEELFKTTMSYDNILPRMTTQRMWSN